MIGMNQGLNYKVNTPNSIIYLKLNVKKDLTIYRKWVYAMILCIYGARLEWYLVKDPEGVQ